MSNILPSLQVLLLLGWEPPRDPEDEIFVSWSRLIIEYVFHKVYFVLNEGTKDCQQSFMGFSFSPSFMYQWYVERIK